MHIQGKKISRNTKLMFKSIMGGNVLVKATLVYNKCCYCEVTSRKNPYYRRGYELCIQEGNPWIELR